MDRLAQQALRGGVTARSISFLSEDVGQDLSYVAATQDCDAILLGWHRASLEHRVVRALVHRIFKDAPRDVVVFVDRRGTGIQGDGQVVALRANDSDAQTADVARRVAESLQSKVVRLSDRDAMPAAAAAAVVAVQQPWNEQDEFGAPATAFARSAECPVLVVRAATPQMPS
jgi:hypothetical protein